MAFAAPSRLYAEEARIDPGQAEAIIKKGDPELMLIDVRSPAEYQSGHIKNAINLEINAVTIESELDRLPRDTPILVYCKSGARSLRAAKMLSNAGFKNVMTLEGGITSWTKAGLPIEK